MANFATALQEKRDQLAKSNQDNLAFAFLAVETKIEEQEAYLERLKNLRDEIAAAGDDPTHLADFDAAKVRRLYDLAHSGKV